jgi:hypothetical protein
MRTGFAPVTLVPIQTFACATVVAHESVGLLFLYPGSIATILLIRNLKVSPMHEVQLLIRWSHSLCRGRRMM